MAATSAGKVPTSSADADDPSSRRLLTVLLRRYGIPIAETVTADCADSAVEAAWWLRFPVTLVADGTRLADHAGITRCGLATPGQVRAAYWQLASALGPAMSGVRIRRQPQPQRTPYRPRRRRDAGRAARQVGARKPGRRRRGRGRSDRRRGGRRRDRRRRRGRGPGGRRRDGRTSLGRDA